MVCIATFCVSCTTENIDTEVNTIDKELFIPEVKPIETKILKLINEYRISLALETLVPIDIVKSQAFNHTQYMIDQNTMSHDYFHKRRSYLIDKAGAIKVAENVGYGYSSAESVVDSWIKSESHRAAIVGDFTNFDISVDQNEDGVLYFTNIFIKK